MLARVSSGAPGASAAIELVTSSRIPALGKFAPIRVRRRNAARILAVSSEGDKEAKAADRSINHAVSFSIYHNVQEGDTLTSIARQYHTTVQVLAQVNKIEDIDLLQTGQALVVPVHPRIFQKVTATMVPSSEEVVKTVAQPRPVMVTRFGSFVRFAASLLLLTPVVVLCLRGFLQTVENKIRLEVSRTQAEKELWDVQHRPRLHRWQRILEGDRESEVALPADAQHLEGDESETEEQRKAREEEELRKSYVELEATYMKFLADSGLSRSGYWRGGIPSSAHHDG